MIELSQQAGRDVHAEAYAHAGFGLVATSKGQFDVAQVHLEQALPLFRESGEVGMAAQTYTWIGTVLLLRHDYDAAIHRFEAGLALGSQIGDRLAMCNALFNLAQLSLARNDYERAIERFVEGIPFSEEMGDWANIAYILEGLGTIVGAQAQHPDKMRYAVQLFGAAEALIERTGLRGHTYYKPDQSLYDHTFATLHAQLGEAVFAAVWSEGKALPLEHILASVVYLSGTAKQTRTP